MARTLVRHKHELLAGHFHVHNAVSSLGAKRKKKKEKEEKILKEKEEKK